MRESRCRAERRCKLGVVVFLVFFVIIVVVFGKVAVFAAFGFFILIIFIIVVVAIFGDDVEMNGMSLRDFQFRLALGATQDLALFPFVLVDVDFSGTLGAANHVFHPP